MTTNDPRSFILAAPGRHYAAFPRSAASGHDLDMYEVIAWMADEDVMVPMVFVGGILRNAGLIKGYSGVYAKTNDTSSGFIPLDKSAGFVNPRIHAQNAIESISGGTNGEVN